MSFSKMFFVNEVDGVLFTLSPRPLAHAVIINVLTPSVSSKVLASRWVSLMCPSSLQSLRVSPTKRFFFILPSASAQDERRNGFLLLPRTR